MTGRISLPLLLSFHTMLAMPKIFLKYYVKYGTVAKHSFKNRLPTQNFFYSTNIHLLTAFSSIPIYTSNNYITDFTYLHLIFES